PVQTDEDVALGKVGPIQVLRRVRSRSLLEHHRYEPERRDGHRSSAPLVGKLTQRRADEHSQTLIWCPDYRCTGQSRVYHWLLALQDHTLVCHPALVGESPKHRRQIVGLIVINAREVLNRDGRLVVTVPETVEASADGLAPALQAA